MDLIEEVYKISRSFPREEIYGLTSQLRRAAVSEGQGRRTTADFLRHLSIAYGSLLELETQVLIATRLGYLAQGKSGCDECGGRGRSATKWTNDFLSKVNAFLLATGHWPLLLLMCKVQPHDPARFPSLIVDIQHRAANPRLLG
ncbi:MAG: four helix bundle protein [bacterium]